MAQNLVSQTMTDAQRDALLADLDAFAAKWAPYMRLSQKVFRAS